MSCEMRYAPVFRQIYYENVVPVQEYISVDFDNRLQSPVSFSYLGRNYDVIELIGAYPDNLESSTITFLVRTIYGVYVIYFDVDESIKIQDHRFPISRPGCWVLQCFVEENAEPSVVDMLVDLKLKQIADFHGHLCPDLVIGYRAAQYALARLEVRLATPYLRVQVENNTSAIDAIQMLTGCTSGNLRLFVQDHDKHVYIFQVNDQHGICLTLSSAGQYVPPAFVEIERKIQDKTASLDEIATYQYLLDERIVQLLTLTSDALFDIQWVEIAWPESPISPATHRL